MQPVKRRALEVVHACLRSEVQPHRESTPSDIGKDSSSSQTIQGLVEDVASALAVVDGQADLAPGDAVGV
jgi:hypothetical protein